MKLPVRCWGKRGGYVTSTLLVGIPVASCGGDRAANPVSLLPASDGPTPTANLPPVTLLAMRDPPLNPILNTVDNSFDDKMAVVNASQRGDIRGTALPLLLDLARKPNFLHDNSVPDLDTLLNASRGAMAPHPFFISDASQRAEMVEFLKELDTNSM